MHTYEARWHGSAWALCCGSWTLKRDGEDITDAIPDDLIDSDMGTYGTYSQWFFGGDDGWTEEWEDYEDGMNCEEWCEANEYWIKNICDDDEDRRKLFETFQGEDFRTSSCGGCI